METLRDYVKIAEAADLLGVSQTTLRKWADEGKIPASVNPANGYRLFRRDDLNRFLKKDRKVSKPTETEVSAVRVQNLIGVDLFAGAGG